MAFIFKVLELKGYKIWFIIYAHALNFEYTTTASSQKLNLIRPIKGQKDKNFITNKFFFQLIFEHNQTQNYFSEKKH